MAVRYDLDNRGGLSKYQYLHRCIRRDIRNGILEVGSCLPTKRSLAAELSVSVSTVEHAYSLLVSDGYLEAKPGSGFVVCSGKAERIAFFDLEDASIPDPALQGKLLDFKANRCSLELFPLETWSRLMRQVLSERDPAMLEPVPFNGLSLRDSIIWKKP